MKRGRWIVAVLVALIVGGGIGFGAGLVVGASDASPVSVDAPPASSQPTAAGSSFPGVRALEDSVAVASQLAALPIVDGYSAVPYNRDLFGQRWADVDRNGCDTRNDILGRDLIDPVFKDGTNNCKVLAGVLLDPYDGRRVDFVSGVDTSVLVQIDHVVPLAWAWRHGAEWWSDEARTAFANDPLNLVAASGATNQAKSASGPGSWLPESREMHCGYIAQWVDVLVSYDLAINDSDRAASEAVLKSC